MHFCYQYQYQCDGANIMFLSPLSLLCLMLQIQIWMSDGNIVTQLEMDIILGNISALRALIDSEDTHMGKVICLIDTTN